MVSGVETGYGDASGSNGFLDQLRTNTEVFAAFKAHRMGRDMASQLLDENGNVKTFQQFKKDTEGIVDHHVNAWLRTEYDTAIKRAHRAAEMRQFIDEADVFPNIEWLPSTAINPREAHMPFYNHVWPVDDPFWEEHKPGDEWGCQCGWRSTDEPVTDNSGLGGDDVAPPSKGLGGNPAKTGQLFTDDHPYFPKDCAHCAFNKNPLKIVSNREKDCYNCKNILNALLKSKLQKSEEIFTKYNSDNEYKEVKIDKKSGGVSACHKKHKFDSEKGAFGIPRGDYEKRTVDALRTTGHTVILESEEKANGLKTPDGYLDGMLMDIKSIEGMGKWAVKDKFHDGTKQGVECVVLYFPEKSLFSMERVADGWEKFKNINTEKQYPQTIKKVVCIVEDEVFEWAIPK